MPRTKAVKLLYLADLRAVEYDGTSGSGVAWQWDRHGPFDAVLYEAERELIDAGHITREATQNFYGAPEYRLAAQPLGSDAPERADRFVAHLDAVLAQHGSRSASELVKMTYETEPMLEARAGGERGVLLDLDETPSVPDATQTLQRFQRMLDEYVDDQTPAPPGCSEEILKPLRAARAKANRILLDDLQ